jgi:cytochrome c oxidase subunit I
VVNTSYFMYMAVLASMLHGFTVPAGVEVGQRLRGVTQGMFGWVKRAPWGDPGFSSLVLSVVVFGFVGGITGVTIGTEQINIVAHNTMRVPGHFHATVVSGTTMAFMGLTYYLIPLIFQKKVAFWRFAQLQPYLFAGGMLVFSIFMSFTGGFGVPRRHWDINFSGAPFEMAFHPAVDGLLAIMALGGVVAAIGGGLYIVITVWSVFFGQKFTDADRVPGAKGIPQGLIRPPRDVTVADEKNLPTGRLGHAPGTMILVAVFLTAFAVYYFANWKLLSFVWKIG